MASSTKPAKNTPALNVVITGASKGMGLAMAEKFAGAGHNLFLCARNVDELRTTSERLQVEFPSVKIAYWPVNLAIKESVYQFAEEVLKICTQVDILINNAGQFVPGSIISEEEGVLDQMLAVNLYSAYHLTRAILPAMMRKKQGHIFNICSIAALKAYDNGGSYSISKFALMGFSKNLREELKPHNIKVTAVYPGAVYTSSWEGSGVAKIRIMEADDIADMILAASLLSPQACVEDIVMRPMLGDV